MTRKLELTRTEGEALIDLLEASADRDSADPRDWRYGIASDLRELFGCRTREDEKAYIAETTKV